MKPSQLAQLLSKAIKACLPVLITGAPGIGKSDIVTQAASEAGADLILSHPAVADPTDAKGLPWVSESKQSATFLPFGELAQALKATKPTVWFLDDLGQAPPSVQASYMQLLLARRVNAHVLPDVVTFVAATNRRVDRAGVSGILEPVKSRFATIAPLEPDLDEWCQWGINKGLPVELVAFLRFRPNLLCDFQPTADLTNCPLPRTWANVGKLLNLGLDNTLLGLAVAGAVGEAAAAEFMAFLRMFNSLPSIDGILLNPDVGDIPQEASVRYAVTTALAAKATTGNFARVCRYAQRLLKERHGEFAVLLIKDCARRHPELQNTSDFIQLMSGELGQMMSGQY